LQFNEIIIIMFTLQGMNTTIQIKESGVDRACSTHGEEKKCMQGFGEKGRRDHIGWRLKSKRLLET
jgi:hypothetical protein